MYKVQIWSKKFYELNLIILACGDGSRRLSHNTLYFDAAQFALWLRSLRVWQVSSCLLLPGAGVWCLGDGGAAHLPGDAPSDGRHVGCHSSLLPPSIPLSLSCSVTLSLNMIRELECYDRESENRKLFVFQVHRCCSRDEGREPSCFDSCEIIYISLLLWNKNISHGTFPCPLLLLWLFSETAV